MNVLHFCSSNRGRCPTAKKRLIFFAAPQSTLLFPSQRHAISLRPALANFMVRLSLVKRHTVLIFLPLVRHIHLGLEQKSGCVTVSVTHPQKLVVIRRCTKTNNAYKPLTE